MCVAPFFCFISRVNSSSRFLRADFQDAMVSYRLLPGLALLFLHYHLLSIVPLSSLSLSLFPNLYFPAVPSSSAIVLSLPPYSVALSSSLNSSKYHFPWRNFRTSANISSLNLVFTQLTTVLYRPKLPASLKTLV